MFILFINILFINLHLYINETGMCTVTDLKFTICNLSSRCSILSGHLDRALLLATSPEFRSMRFREMRGIHTPEKYTSIGVGTSPFSKMRTPGKSPMRSLHRLDTLEEQRQVPFCLVHVFYPSQFDKKFRLLIF